MQLADIEGLLRSHLIEGEVMTEGPSDYYGDRMYTITTAGLPVHVYTIQDEGVYAIAAVGALEVWQPGVDDADRTVEAVLGHARRDGAPLPPPDPEVVFADAIAYLRPLLREGESLSTGRDRNGDPTLTISAQVGGGTVRWNGGAICYTSPRDPGYNNFADNKEDREELIRRVLLEARTPIDWDQLRPVNR